MITHHSDETHDEFTNLINAMLFGLDINCELNDVCKKCAAGFLFVTLAHVMTKNGLTKEEIGAMIAVSELHLHKHKMH